MGKDFEMPGIKGVPLLFGMRRDGYNHICMVCNDSLGCSFQIKKGDALQFTIN